MRQNNVAATSRIGYIANSGEWRPHQEEGMYRLIEALPTDQIPWYKKWRKGLTSSSRRWKIC